MIKFIGFLLLLAFTIGTNYQRHKTLIILDNIAIKETYSSFFQILKDHNHEIDIKMNDSSKITLKKFDDFIYNNIIFIAPSIQKFQYKIKEIMDFYNYPGHNIMIISYETINDYIKKLCYQFGVSFPNPTVHLNGSHSCKKSNSSFSGFVTWPIFQEKVSGIELNGIPLNLDHKNPYVFPLLRGDVCMFSEDNQNNIISSGKNIELVAGYQSDKNNRVIIHSLFSMCSNLYINRNVKNINNIRSSENYQFCEELIEWNFHELGVIKAENIQVIKASDNQSYSEYNVAENVQYSVDLSTFDPTSGKWIPYQDSSIYLELVMLDPYYRVILNSDPATSSYKKIIQVPDKQGVYNFILNITRKGYSYILNETKLVVRPIRHNEIPRFNFAAFPIYFSVLACMIGLLIFVYKLLLTKDEIKQKKD